MYCVLTSVEADDAKEDPPVGHNLQDKAPREFAAFASRCAHTRKAQAEIEEAPLVVHEQIQRAQLVAGPSETRGVEAWAALVEG